MIRRDNAKHTLRVTKNDFIPSHLVGNVISRKNSEATQKDIVIVFMTFSF